MFIPMRKFSQPSQYVAEAKMALMNARYHKQREEAAREIMHFLNPDVGQAERDYKNHKFQAKHWRKKAKQALKNHEEVIGTFWMMGIKKDPLKKSLNGRDFSEWVEWSITFFVPTYDKGDLWL